MEWFSDIHHRQIRFTSERGVHIETDHPEMAGQINKIQDTLMDPEAVVRSISDIDVELFYRHYESTPVTDKYLCVAIKVLCNDIFIITAYFTDSIKKGDMLWKKK